MYYGIRSTPWYQKSGAWLAIVAAIACVIFIGSCASSYYTEAAVKITVTGKESVNTKDGHKYRIYSDDEVYVMKDSLVKGRFRTANDYARLQRGHTYTCTKFGMRVPALSWFENIKDCREAS